LRFLRDDNFADEVGGYGYGKLAVFLPRIWLISADFNGFYLVRLTAKGFLRNDNFFQCQYHYQKSIGLTTN
jgi:hypothetical protein